MRPALSLKTLYRSPVRMILTFVLLVAVTFTLFSQVLEHAVTVREINKAAEQYDGVGAVEVTNVDNYPDGPFYLMFDQRVPVDDYSDKILEEYDCEYYQPITQEQMDTISNLQYISSVETRYMTAGVSYDFLRMDEGYKYYNYAAQCVIEGTLSEINQYFQYEWQGETYTYHYLKFSDFEVLGGYFEENVKDGNIPVYLQPYNEFGGGYIGERRTTFSTPSYKYDDKFVETLNIGDRYVFVMRYEPFDGYDKEDYQHSDYFAEQWLEDTIWCIEDAPENYLETEKYAEIKEIIDIINLNHHTFDVVYTDNMSSTMRFARGNMAIVDGREITYADSLNNSSVCVVSREFAIENGLVIGDKITMQLGNKLFEQYEGLGAIPIVPERVSDSYVEADLEIVGIYSDLDSPTEQAKNPNWGYSINTIFVPKALLNVSDEEIANHTFAPGEVSFVVEDAWNIPAFLEECAPVIEEMGLTLIFEDENWLDMVDGFTASKELAVIKIGVLSAAVLVATWFVAMLYILGRKKDYAIMRVLGTTVRKSNASMLLPFMTLVLISVIIGALAAYINTSRTIESSNALQVLSEFAIDTSIPLGALLLCVLSELTLAFVIALMMLSNLGKKPPLVLMQGDGAKRKKLRKILEEPQEPITFIDWEITPIEKLKKHPKYARRFVWKYIFRHIKRTSSKALLTMLLCVLLLNVVGQLDIMKRSYSNLVDNTEVKSNYVGGLPLGDIPDLHKSGYVTDIYYWSSSRLELDGMPTTLVVTNDVIRSTEEDTVVTYVDGYNETSFEGMNNYIVVGKQWMELYGYEYGDKVWIGPQGVLLYIQSEYISKHQHNYPKDERPPNEIIDLYSDKIFGEYATRADEFLIIGSVESPSGLYNDKVFTPGTLDESAYYGRNCSLDTLEATVADNNLVDEYREFGQELAGGSVTEGVMFVMDTSKLENLRNTLRLVEMLYPIAVVVTLVIGTFLCGLIIVQTSKDIAIMRVLGTSKAKTRTILVLEQMILCVIGIIISGVVLYIRGALMQMLWVFGAYAIVILLAAIVASVAASRKNVLELLQTKE